MEGEAVRQAVARFASDHPEVTSIRVINGRELEASTDPQDQGDKAAPRSLTRDEKPLFDLGQKLRAAVEGNREGAEGAARAPEIAIERLGDRLSLAAPVERGGEVLGMVQMETKPEREPAAFAWLPFLAAWLAPVIVLLLLSFVLGERRWVLAAAAALLLVAGLWMYGRYALGALNAERRQSSQAVAAQVGEESKKTEALLAELGIPAGQPLDPTLWDVDEHRQSRGLITSDLAVDEGRLGEVAGADAGSLTRSVATLALISLALLGFVGLGWAARTGAALVEHRVAYAYVAAGHARHAGAGLLPVLLRRRAVVHQLQHLQHRQAGVRDLDRLAELRRHPVRLPVAKRDARTAWTGTTRTSITRWRSPSSGRSRTWSSASRWGWRWR